MGDMDPPPVRFGLEAEMVRPIGEPMFGTCDLGNGEIGQGPESGVYGVMGWFVPAAQDPNLMVAEKGQPACLQAQFLKEPKTGIARWAAID